MLSVKPDISIADYQKFVKKVYGLPNDRSFNSADMLSNVERFLMRGLKGIRKENPSKTVLNLIIAQSWFMSLMNQLHIDLEDHIWNRFPYQCSYCAHCPCVCKAQKIKTRQPVKINNRLRPKTLAGFQNMLEKIYPAKDRTLEHAGVHLAEEMGEMSEAVMIFRGNHRETDFGNIILESADLFSCFMGVFNSLKVNVAKELSKMFSHNCHICHQAPCVCSFEDVIKIKT